MDKWPEGPIKALPLLGLLVISPVQAGDWKVSNSIDLKAIFTDNLQLASDGEAGVITSVRPTIGLQGEGGRVHGSLSYKPVLFSQNGDSLNDTGVNHHLLADFTAELVDQRLFLDTRASAGLVTATATADSRPDGVGDEASQVYSFGIRPYSRHRLGSHATLELAADADWLENSRAASQLDSNSVGLSATMQSGTEFSRFPWSLAASHSQVEYEGHTDERSSLRGSAGYRINRIWRVDASLGYQDNDIRTSRTDASGMTVSGSVQWTPTPRTAANVEVGSAYFGAFWNLDLTHRSRRTTWTLGYRRDISNARTYTLGQDFVDRPVLVLRPVDEDFLSTRLSGSVAVKGKRTDLLFSMDLDRREYEITPAAEEVVVFRADLDRRITPGLTAGLNVSWQDVDSDLTASSRIWDVGVSLSASVGRHSELKGEIAHRDREQAGGGSYDENRVGLTFSTRMF